MIRLKSLLKESLLNELDFGTQKAFDAYQKKHDMRGDTEVTVAGKKMSVTQAVKQSGDKGLKGSPVFGNNKGGEVFGNKNREVEERDAKVLDRVGMVLKKAYNDDTSDGAENDFYELMHHFEKATEEYDEKGRKEAGEAMKIFKDTGDYKQLSKLITKSLPDDIKTHIASVKIPGQSNDKKVSTT